MAKALILLCLIGTALAARLDPDAASAPAPAPAPLWAAPAPAPAPAAAAATRALPLPRPARPPMPPWLDEVEWLRGTGEPHQAKWDRQRANREAVGQLNATRAARGGDWTLDLLLYGDSLTYALQRPPQAAWRRHFGEDGRTPHTLALGMSGSTVAALAWRIVNGEELPAVQPRVTVLWIGVNDVVRGLERPEERLEWLVQWLRGTWPETQLAAMALLPTTWGDVAPANRAYASLARRMGFTLIKCGQDWDPTDAELFGDELHLTPEGQDRLLACMRDGVEPLLPPRRPAAPGGGIAGGLAAAEEAG